MPIRIVMSAGRESLLLLKERLKCTIRKADGCGVAKCEVICASISSFKAAKRIINEHWVEQSISTFEICVHVPEVDYATNWEEHQMRLFEWAFGALEWVGDTIFVRGCVQLNENYLPYLLECVASIPLEYARRSVVVGYFPGAITNRLSGALAIEYPDSSFYAPLLLYIPGTVCDHLKKTFSEYLGKLRNLDTFFNLFLRRTDCLYLTLVSLVQNTRRARTAVGGAHRSSSFGALWPFSRASVAYYRDLEQRAIAHDKFTNRKKWIGRGIVTCAGGIKYFLCLWVQLHELQRLGCQLPIEVWCLHRAELLEWMRSLLSRFGNVTIRVAEEHRARGEMRCMTGAWTWNIAEP